MVLVEQSEVVDIDEGDRHRPTGRAGRFRLEGEQADDRAVVERAGQRVAPGRFDEFGRLAGQAALGGPEDEEQQGGRDQRGGQGHEHDVASDGRESIEDRHGIAPDPDDTEDLAVDREREVLAQQRRGAEGIGTGLGRLGRKDHRPGLAADGQGEVATDRHRLPADGWVVRGHDGAIGPAQFDAQDLAGSDERRELDFQLRPDDRARSGIRHGRGRGEVGGADVGVHERPRGRGIAADDVGERRRRKVRTDHQGLRRGGDADERDECPEDEDEQRRSREFLTRAEHAGPPFEQGCPGRPTVRND